MNDSNKLFEQISNEFTQKGQLFEIREYTDSLGLKNKEFATFSDSLRKYFDFAAMHGDKDFLVFEDERFSFADAFKISAKVGNALLLMLAYKKVIEFLFVCRIILNLYLHIWE
mgnify:CR=1 FL=1